MGDEEKALVRPHAKDVPSKRSKFALWCVEFVRLPTP